ncbi:MAG: BON domain-containing protein [Bdellovibrionales bacterium]|nr:BON domain-containing protein [Bdellovibrionales bacterium]
MKVKNYKAAAQILLERIQNRIRWDIRVSNSDVSIKVKNGVVTLNGYFDKPYRHAAAVSVIKTTEGVVELKDQSQVVDDYCRTDKELETLISKQILTLPLLPGEWIDVDVCDGVVKLEGLVFRPRLKAFAARASWELSGIKDCINLIGLKESLEEVEKSLKLEFSELNFLRLTGSEQNPAIF